MADDASYTLANGRYALKRAVDGLTKESAIGFLKLILNTDIKEEAQINFSYAQLFKSYSLDTLYYTTKNRKDTDEKDKEDPGFFLYKSDLAFLFADIYYKLIGGDPQTILSFYTKEAPTDVLKKATAIIDYCKSHDFDLEISKDDDRYLNSLLTDYIKPVARFLIAALEKTEKKEEEEEKEEDEEETQSVDTAVVATGTTQAQENEEENAENEGKDEENRPLEEKKETKPEELLDIKSQLFSPALREQSVNFTEIALVQLEIFHKLPPGTLQNSRELRELLSQKTTGFFLTVIGDGKHKNLLDPETRLTLIREYIWMVQNDFRTTSLISNRLEDIVKGNTDPKIKEQIENAIERASQGEDISPLIQSFSGVFENSKEQEILTSLSGDKLASGDVDYLTKETDKLLETELRRIGVRDDRLALSKTNVVNVIDSWIDQAYPIELLKYIDEGRFRLIFGDEIPFRPDIYESLQEIWIARRSILGRKTGQILLHNEARFATREALDLLDKSKGEISASKSNQVFARGVAAPTNKTMVGAKAISSNPGEIVELTNGKSPLIDSKKKEAFLKSVWENIQYEEREQILVALGYGEAGGNAVKNIANDVNFVPRELAIHDLAPLIGGAAASYDQSQANGYESQYIPQAGVIRSPLSSIKSFRKQTAGLGNKLKRGINGVSSRLSKKAAAKAAEKAAEAGLSSGAAAAGTAIHPALGFFAKIATTKKGRQALLIGGGLGLGSLIVPLLTWGGRIGATLGGVLGGIFGGPGGALAGAIGGGWLGYGAEKWFGDLFSGAKSASAIFVPRTSSSISAANSALAKKAAINNAIPHSNLIVTKSVTHIATQAVLTSAGLITGGNLLLHAVQSGALLANFPIVDPLSTVSGSTPGKESEYVTIEKRAFIAGCPENKCENPAFPLKVEYTITITPKGNFTLQVLDAKDTLKVNHSKKAWEEEGKTPPTIPDRIKNLTDFPELYEEMVITPGESVVLSYSETFDEKYDNASILNTFDLKIFAKDPETGVEGTDNAITGEVVYIGDYSQGAGCWPASGTITQLPGGSYSHQRVDAFDIANSEGTPIFAPFDGEACPGNMDPGYGIHVVLKSAEGSFVLAHMRSSNTLSCKSVSAGEILGVMGNTGNSSGPHLHFGLIGSPPNSGTLPSLMPDGASVKVNDPVRTCYE